LAATRRCRAGLCLRPREYPSRSASRERVCARTHARLLGDETSWGRAYHSTRVAHRRRCVRVRRRDRVVPVDRGLTREPATSRRSRSRSACRQTDGREQSRDAPQRARSRPDQARWTSRGDGSIDGNEAFLPIRTRRAPRTIEVPFGHQLSDRSERAGAQTARTRRATRRRQAGLDSQPNSSDLPLTFADARADGAKPDPGVVSVYERVGGSRDRQCLGGWGGMRIDEFFRDEPWDSASLPRGTVRQEEATCTGSPTERPTATSRGPRRSTARYARRFHLRARPESASAVESAR